MSNDKREITVSVEVQYSNDGTGNCGGGRYMVTCDPDGITVVKRNTTIIYQLSSTTPKAVILTGYTADVQGQLGEPAFTNQGRTMSINDADSNTETQKIKVTLLLADTFADDPEVTNAPDPQ